MASERITLRTWPLSNSSSLFSLPLIWQFLSSLWSYKIWRRHQLSLLFRKKKIGWHVFLFAKRIFLALSMPFLWHQVHLITWWLSQLPAENQERTIKDILFVSTQPSFYSSPSSWTNILTNWKAKKSNFEQLFQKRDILWKASWFALPLDSLHDENKCLMVVTLTWFLSKCTGWNLPQPLSCSWIPDPPQGVVHTDTVCSTAELLLTYQRNGSRHRGMPGWLIWTCGCHNKETKFSSSSLEGKFHALC